VNRKIVFLLFCFLIIFYLFFFSNFRCILFVVANSSCGPNVRLSKRAVRVNLCYFLVVNEKARGCQFWSIAMHYWVAWDRKKCHFKEVVDMREVVELWSTCMKWWKWWKWWKWRDLWWCDGIPWIEKSVAQAAFNVSFFFSKSSI